MDLKGALLASASLTVSGLVLGCVYGAGSYLWEQTQAYLYVTLHVANTDFAFTWITLWLEHHQIAQTTSKFIVTTYSTPDYSGSAKSIDLVPVANGARFVIVFECHPIFIHCNYSLADMKKAMTYMLETTFKEPELSFAYTLQTSTLAGADHLHKFLVAANKLQRSKLGKALGLLTADVGGFGQIRYSSPRSIDTVVLADNLGAKLLKDMEWFYSNQEWFDAHGVPYHRGYLLCGPPGNGKTSLLRAIASTLQRPLCIIDLSSERILERLAGLINSAPRDGIIVLEDLDRVDLTTSLSGILNAMDGLGSGEGRVMFVTANDRSKFPDVMVRPGRIDEIIELGNATEDQAVRLYGQFCPGDEKAAAWAAEHKGKSMAELQKMLVKKL